ncbi:[protein-PII] uridylyltransferase [Rhabdothermincola salaria]|uniref:[protein-PII] uridylyltransferase n=1 Tax=Rhabdothermincola salaria TaxID=2903142 RepID=UPI001E2EF1BC|nr:[protein-PII] uridylyltransferase [Rhabdothermincola salaria]
MTPRLDRQHLLDDPALRGFELCRALSERTDEWLAALWDHADGPSEGAALVAVGGYGRAELAPGSDIDVLLLHDPSLDVADLAERFWYPIWDEGLKLGHAVRTVKDTLSLASTDLDTATSVLTVRGLAGDADLAAELADKGLALWQKRSRRWLEQLSATVVSRHGRAGEVAFLLEPDLKDGRGGLRDVHAIGWAEKAQANLLPGDEADLDTAYRTLLATRVELHRRTGRPGDRLSLEEQDGVADALGYLDADDLMRDVSTAARAIAWVSDDLWARVDSSLEGPFRRRLFRDRDVAPGVLLREGTVQLALGADPESEPLLPLRVAVAAARHEARIERDTLRRLAACPPLPVPWPEAARRLFVELFLAGRPAVDVVETLDQRALWEPIVPEWAAVRCKPQRNAYHRFTVDRHLCEAAANAAALVDRVDRADLLVVGTLLHDIGKGFPGDHTEVGIDIVGEMAPRMGFTATDTALLQQMVRHHLLLPDVATRRDLSDDGTIDHVAEAVGDLVTLRLLHGLTEADSLATGPAAWGSWKEELVGVLVARVSHVLDGGQLADVADAAFPNPHHLALLAQRRRIIEGVDDRLTVVSPDRPGLFARVAGVLSLHGLTVLEAAATTDEDDMALEAFRVEPNYGSTVPWDRVVRDLERALDGRLALEARLAERARVYARPRRLPGLVTHPEVIVDNDLSHAATVLEVHAPDAMGVLWRITRALHELDLDLTSAKIQTLGTDAVDSFYVLDNEGRKVTDATYLAEIERALLFALGEAP